jgi:NitT/TauT family transport system substrate-binding protein
MDAISPSFTIAAYFTTADWAKSHPDELRNFQDAMRNAAIWANNNHDKSAEILSAISHIDIGVVRSMTRIPYPERLIPSMIQPVIDITAKYGGGADFAATELMYRP